MSKKYNLHLKSGANYCTDAILYLYLQKKDMELTLTRIRKNETTIIGLLHVGEEFLCWTLENANKAIPKGTYALDHNTLSPRFAENPFYKRVCSGKLPRLVQVPHRQGILVHCGNSFLDSSGCILVGRCLRENPWGIVSSKATFERVYPTMHKATSITIK